MFELPKVSFNFSDFEPVIDSKTMEIHYTKHHQTYVDNLNKLLPEESKSLEEVLSSIDTLDIAIKQGVINNAGGHWNHTFWWEQLQTPNENNRPIGLILDSINSSFSSFDIFVEQFSKAAMTRFGSGWAWLLLKKDGKLAIESTVNQDCPLMNGEVPILGLDVWEHAYYLTYQNRRIEYVSNFWKLIDWKVVDARLVKANS